MGSTRASPATTTPPVFPDTLSPLSPTSARGRRNPPLTLMLRLRLILTTDTTDMAAGTATVLATVDTTDMVMASATAMATTVELGYRILIVRVVPFRWKIHF